MMHQLREEYENGQRHGTCSCGWAGENRAHAADARRDYVEHVEEAMGAAAYYEAEVACSNCGSEHEQGIVIGTPVASANCARCGCLMLQPNNETFQRQSRRGPREETG